MVLLGLSCLPVVAQQITIRGVITDSVSKPVAFAGISVQGTSYGTAADSKGYFVLQLPQQLFPISLQISCLGYETRTIHINEQKTEHTINVRLSASYHDIDAVYIRGDIDRSSTLIRISSKEIEHIPSMGSSVEASIKTMPGVSSRSELSSQYSVRGGNFDENLLYINEVEVYRPMLVRSGQQEGMSIINPDMVSAVRFSSGGFHAAYGDRMSSVLDISYKKPQHNGGGITASMIGGSAFIEGLSKNKKLAHISGLRYRRSRYMLNSLRTEGEYNPEFFDAQSYITYDMTSKTEINLLGNIALNKYVFIPKSIDQAFGTYNSMYKLSVFYEGNEVDRFETYLGALTLQHKVNEQTEFSWINSAYSALETETFDILGEYLIDQVDNTIDPSAARDSAINIGIGAFRNHARNYLDAYVFSSALQGRYTAGRSDLTGGVKWQREYIYDDIHEWEIIDSTGYSLPYSDSEIHMMNSIIGKNTHISNRITAFTQISHSMDVRHGQWAYTAGARLSRWDMNNEWLVSPRATLSFKPSWEHDYLFRFSAGYYYQPPFYREMRFSDGSINKNIKSQKSVHFVLGSDHNLQLWNRPFKIIAEAYYKYLDNLIPYKIDNIRLRYAGKNMAKGYATGLDMKINGEFVKGTQSWASLSVMRTMEDIDGDYYINKKGETIRPGYYPRPTDQLINVGLFFQDYFPKYPSIRVHLTGYYGSRLPYSPPFSERYDNIFRIPPYRRVDMGISKVLKSEDSNIHSAIFSGIKSCWLSIEVFNLFNIRNTISYLWVKTISSGEYIPDMFAVPNYLTGRRINVKLTVKF